jgi:hypothetical protein
MVGDKLLQQTLQLAASGQHPRFVGRRNLHYGVRSAIDFHIIAYVSCSSYGATANIWTHITPAVCEL